MQLQYFVDPNGIKVFQNIAANASRPQAGLFPPRLEWF